MSAADLLEDGFPHGTPTGYDQGCRGAGCPTGVEFGLSCRVAWERSKGDYQYQKLARQGVSVADIAAALGVHPEPHHPVKRKPVVPDEDDDVYVEEENTVATTENGTNVSGVAPEPQGGELTAETDSPSSENDRSGHVPPDPSAVRVWAKANGVLVSPRGPVPRSVVDAYLAAHADTAEPQKPVTVLVGPPVKETADSISKQIEKQLSRISTRAVDDATAHLTAELEEARSALEFVLRAWAGEQARRAAQERLVFTLATEVNALNAAARADGDLIMSMDYALIAADVEIAQLSHALQTAQRQPWFRRRAS